MREVNHIELSENDKLLLEKLKNNSSNFLMSNLLMRSSRELVLAELS